MHESLTDVEVVDATRERVKTDNDLHAVSVDGVLGGGVKVGLLISMPERRSWDINPSSLGGRNADSVDTDSSKLVSCGSVQEGCISSLKYRPTLAVKCLT